MRAAIIALVLLFASVGLAQNNGNLGGNPVGPPVPIPQIPIIVSTGTTVLPACGALICGYVLDMRSTSNIVMPCSYHGQGIQIETWQNPAFGGGFTPTFVGCGFPSATYQVGEPSSFPSAVLISNGVQYYSWWTDLITRGPFYIFTGPGAQ